MSRKGGLLVAWFGLGLLCGGLWTDARKVSPERDRAIAAVKARRPKGSPETVGQYLDSLQRIANRQKMRSTLNGHWTAKKVGREWRVMDYDRAAPTFDTPIWRVGFHPLRSEPLNALAKGIESDMER